MKKLIKQEVMLFWKRKNPLHQIVVPEHKNLRIGTLNSILRMVSAHKDVSREDILDTLK
jgi:hypothetical protein